MQKIPFVVQSGALAVLFALSLSMTASAACRTETRFNEFTRTWSTNDVCDFGTVPAAPSWSFISAPSYVPAPVYVAPSYTVPSFNWSLPTWILSSADMYAAPVYTAPVIVEDVPVYQVSSWVPGWLEEPVESFTDACDDFFTVWE